MRDSLSIPSSRIKVLTIRDTISIPSSRIKVLIIRDSLSVPSSRVKLHPWRWDYWLATTAERRTKTTHKRVGQKINLRFIYFGLIIFSSKKTVSGLILLLCHIIEAFIVSWDELCYFLLIVAHVLCEQPSCHNCSDLAIVFKFRVTRRRKQMIIAWRRNSQV
jgi:hypothetical protein